MKIVTQSYTGLAQCFTVFSFADLPFTVKATPCNSVKYTV
jgi:hypothetical protein